MFALNVKPRVKLIRFWTTRPWRVKQFIIRRNYLFWLGINFLVSVIQVWHKICSLIFNFRMFFIRKLYVKPDYKYRKYHHVQNQQNGQQNRKRVQQQTIQI